MFEKLYEGVTLLLVRAEMWTSRDRHEDEAIPVFNSFGFFVVFVVSKTRELSCHLHRRLPRPTSKALQPSAHSHSCHRTPLPNALHN
jgi:hypothetical protein